MLGELAVMEHQLMLSASKLLRSCDFRHIICPDSVKYHVLVCIEFCIRAFFTNIICIYHYC